ncbi:hypothetical protein [Cellulomonas sp. SG140]|uniref:hypothetical protein n=1 Tax=Cellulomonas sp. SG140 TaxID=2976536 RepID=UPI0021E935C2|nr:hypothetical protein [Cellulomonas sp. SG140]
MTSTTTSSTVRADARERALRTLWTSLGVDLAVAVGVVLSTWIVDADLSSPAAWTGLGLLVARSAITSVASYLVRMKVTPAITASEDAPAAA